MTSTWRDSKNFTNKQGCIVMGKKPEGSLIIKVPPRGNEKVCLICGKNYKPVQYQYERQKYCSKTCKDRMAWMKCKEKGVHKGGYSRHVPLVLWLKAKDIKDHTAPCHYCGTNLEPTTFIIDHKIPRSIVLDKHKIKNDIDNMVICCKDCNNLKGSTDYETFKARVAENDPQVHD
jgi:5-methylcytosine-specific restriction endonuclease McrA